MIQRIWSKSPPAHHPPQPQNNKNIEIKGSAQSVNISKSRKASTEEHPHVHACDKTMGFGCKSVKYSL